METACGRGATLILEDVARRPRFSYRQQSIHIRPVRKKVVVGVVMMESSGSQVVTRWWRFAGRTRYVN